MVEIPINGEPKFHDSDTFKTSIMIDDSVIKQSQILHLPDGCCNGTLPTEIKKFNLGLVYKIFWRNSELNENLCVNGCECYKSHFLKNIERCSQCTNKSL